MIYLTDFETLNDYNAVKDTLPKPNVSLIMDTDEVMYIEEEPAETRLVCLFKPYYTDKPTDIVSKEIEANPENVFSAIEIDGVEQQGIVTSYTFSTTDNHTVKYTLTDPTTIVEYCFYGYVDYDLCMTNVVIPNSVTSIGRAAFRWCDNLTAITFSNNLVTIGNNAFESCWSVENLAFPDSLISIGEGAFYNCQGLVNVTFGNSITNIGYGAFDSCESLTTITLPNSIESIGGGVFISCEALTSITCLATTPPTLGENAFGDTNYPIYVPAASVDAYKAASGWSNYASRIQAIP